MDMARRAITGSTAGAVGTITLTTVGVSPRLLRPQLPQHLSWFLPGASQPTKVGWDGNRALDWVGDYKRIRRRREPPIQSFPCRTDRKGRFAGGGSRQFNHFHAELATGQICSFPTELTAGKARNVSSGQIRLLIERAGRFAGGGLCSLRFRGGSTETR